MKRNQKEQLLSMVEGAIMLALAVALDYLCKLIPFEWPFGGGITVAAIPLIYYTLRRGTAWGLGAGFVYAVLQIVLPERDSPALEQAIRALNDAYGRDVRAGINL